MSRDDDPDGNSEVQSFRSSPERTVFTEEDNPEGWIATDLSVEPPQ